MFGRQKHVLNGGRWTDFMCPQVSVTRPLCSYLEIHILVMQVQTSLEAHVAECGVAVNRLR